MNLKTAAFLIYCIFFSCLPFSISIAEACVISILVLLIMIQAQSFLQTRVSAGGQNISGHVTGRFLFPAVPVNLYVCVFVFFFLLSFAVTSFQTPENFYVSFRGFLKIIKWFIVFYGVVTVVDSPKKIRFVSLVVLISCAVIILNGIFQLVYGHDLFFGYTATAPYKFPRVRSSFSSDNAFATYLMMTVPFAVLSGFVLMRKLKNNWSRQAARALLWILITAAFICFAQTRTRGAWIALVLALIGVWVVQRPKKTTNILIVLSIVTVCIAPILINGISNNFHVDSSTGVIRFIFDEDIFTYTAKDLGRVKLWAEALQMSSNHFFFGVGPNAYAKVAVGYKSFQYGGIYPHNSYLKLLVELGFFAFLAFMSMLAALIHQLVRSIRDSRESKSDLVIIQAGVFIAVASFMMKAFVDTEIESLQRIYMFWFFAGLGISISKVLLLDRFQSQAQAAGEPISVLHIGNQQSIRRLIGMHMAHQKQSGYRVTALTSSKAPYSEVHGIPVKTISFEEQSISPVRDFFEFMRLVRVIFQISPDIVHTHSVKFGIFGRIAARIAGVPYVIHTAHGIYRPHNVNALRRLMIDGLEKIAGYFCDSILFVSRFDLTAYVERKIVSSAKASWIGNGINLERFNLTAHDRDEVMQKRREIGVGDHHFLIGLVARLVRDKGCEEFFEVARMISEHHPNVRFLVITLSYSRNDSIPEETAVKYGLKDKIIFLHDRDDMPILYLALDLLVHPSWREGFPRSLMEASAMGVPCVVSDIDGNQNVIENEVNGLTFQVKNSKDMADKITWAMSHSQEMKRMAFKSREKAAREFDQKKMFERIEFSYREVLSGSPSNKEASEEFYEMASR